MSRAMGRLALSGVFDENPELKIVTHHMGAMIPYFEGRVGVGLDQLGRRTDDKKTTRRMRANCCDSTET
jgi:predicted TIM-barrel fold metal-dependent hydrolase